MDKSKERVNVPRCIDDPHYRYTMPILRVKVEGRGKMIKTLLLNLPSVANDVFRSPEYLLKFFGFEFAAPTKIDATERTNVKFIVCGQRDVNELEDALDKFIDGFVLCGECKNPETVLHVKKGSVSFRCKACGSSTKANMAHRLSNYILKNPPKNSDEEQDSRLRPIQTTKGTSAATEDWVVDTSPEAIAARRSELIGASAPELFRGELDSDQETSEPIELFLSPGQDPLELLKNFWNSKPPLETVADKVRAFQKLQGWTDTQMFSLVFGSLFDTNFEKAFADKAKMLSLFVAGPKDEKTLLFCLEKLCQMQPSLIPKTSGILQNFYDQNLLDDDVIFDWFEEPNKKIPAKISREIRTQSKEFVDWLENAPGD